MLSFINRDAWDDTLENYETYTDNSAAFFIAYGGTRRQANEVLALIISFHSLES